MRKGEREGTPLNKNATVVSLRENNTFIITAHCGVWFHRERERVSLRENNTFNNNNNDNTFE